MDFQHERSTEEKMNKKNDIKGSSVVFHNAWLTLLGSFALFSVSHSVDIKSEVHKDALLPCVVVYRDKFDYNILVVNWQRAEDDTVVHSFFHGSSQPDHTNSCYRGRTELFYESLPNGNASLLLRDLTKSDAGNYACHVILQQSSGYLTRYVNLTVYDVPVNEEMKNITLILNVALLSGIVFVLVLVASVVLYVRHYKNWNGRAKDEEAQPLYEKNPDVIKKYRKTFQSPDYKDIFERQFIFAKGNLFSTCRAQNVSFEEKQKQINVKELFTPENKPLMSKRMLLVGDAGTGKSYFCKWLVEKWAKDGIVPYQCIIYVSGKTLKNKKDKTSVKEIVEEKCKGLYEVLDMLDVLLILDELDCLVHDAGIPNTDLPEVEDNTMSLQLNTLIECIIRQQLLHEMDVLIVSRLGSPIIKQHEQHFTSTFVLPELNDAEASEAYDSISTISADMYTRAKSISHKPSFVSMLCKVNRFSEIVKDFTSPYELVISFLQQYLNNPVTNPAKDTIKQLAEVSYQNLVKGEKEKCKSSETWGNFLKFFNCDSSSSTKYHWRFLRDMLAALHCVWELTQEDFKCCLDFWLFGARQGDKRSCPLLAPVAEEHHAKYYHFIRFFMRLLPYPDYKSLCSNDRNMNEDVRKLLRDYFRNIMKDLNGNDEKLTVVHCVFELHDEDVTEELSFVKDFCLVNTPLNSLDIRALVYCFKNARLEKLDLRLCALTDQNVEELKSIIGRTDYVLLSSNRLTSETGIFFGKLLKEPECLLKKLALGTNNLGSWGAQALWKALEHNTRLESLYLYDNNIGDEGINGMVEHLLKNNSLEELHLCQNAFGEDAIQNIKMLKDKKTKPKVVVTITEDLELFEYAENKVEGLHYTWSNYDQEWLMKLLEAVQADLQNKDWDMDAGLTLKRVEDLIMQIENITGMIRREKVKSEEMERERDSPRCL